MTIVFRKRDDFQKDKMGLRYYDYTLALFDTTVKTADKTYADYYENGGTSLNVQVCFPAGTPVLLADGTTKNIEDIQPGDMVKTVDHQQPDSIIADGRVFKNDPQPLLRLKFEGFEICATKEHPFYVKGKGWIVAENL